jgi:erythritol transport system permease protein
MADAKPAPASSRSAGEGFDIARLLLEGRAFFALIAIIVVFSFLSPYYFTVGNFLTMASHVAIYGILAIGMLLVILNGGIDLSVGSTLGLAGVISGFLMQGVTLNGFGIILYPPVWVVAVLACALGAVVGLVNGVLIARFKVPAFVATLGVMYMVRGVALLITNGLTYNNMEGKPELGNTGFDWLGFNRLFGVPIGVVVLAVLAILGSVVLNRSAFGRWLYASGGNERAAELSGVPVKKVQVSVYVLSGICAVIIGISSYWQTVFTGAVIVLAVLLNAVQYRRRVKLPSATAGSTASAPTSGKA